MRFFEGLEDFPGRAIEGPRPSVISGRPTPGLGRRDGRLEIPVRGVAAGAGSGIGPIAPSREMALDQRFSRDPRLLGALPLRSVRLASPQLPLPPLTQAIDQATTTAPATWRAEAVTYASPRTPDTKLPRNKSALTSALSGCSVFLLSAITRKGRLQILDL